MEGTAGPKRGRALAGAAVLALVVAAAVGFLVFPTYPVYDSYYALLWARELLDGSAPAFEGFRVPTEHPLAIAVALLLVPLGDGADRVWVALVLASFVWLIVGVGRLAAGAFTPLVGVLAALLLLTRLDYAFLAVRGYVDIPYMALVVQAAVLEQRRPRRGIPVLALLAAAGLLRPEAWLLSALYWLWLAPAVDARARVRAAALAAVGPVLWATCDLLVTGDPLFSLTHTSGSAEDLGRTRTLAELPAAVPDFLAGIVKLPVAVAAAAGLAVAVLAAPRRSAMPLALLLSGVGTFAAIGVAGLSVIQRYLATAALALLVFAAVALGGWTLLRPSRLRTAWRALAAVVLVAGAAHTALNLDLSRLETELRFRGEGHDALERVLRADVTRAALRCGPLTVPNHKLVPDARWVLDAPPDRVRARADPDARPSDGPQLYVTGRFALFRQAFTDADDPPAIQVPPDGHVRGPVFPPYAIYVRPAC